MKRKRFSAVLGCILTLAILAGIAVPLASAAEQTITFLNPLGKVEPLDNQALAERLDDLNGKTILPLYDAGTGGQQAVQALGNLLKEGYPEVTIAAAQSLGALTSAATFNAKTAAQYDTWAAAADAVIIGVVNENLAAWWIARHAKELETRGVPVVVVVNSTFAAAVTSGAQDNGFAAMRTAVIDHTWYAKAFVQGTNATTVQTYMANNVFVNDNLDADLADNGTVYEQVVNALTAPLTDAEKSTAPLDASAFGYIDEETFTVSGSSYEKAIRNFQSLSMDMNFGDGVPLVIPTQSLVDAMIAATDRDADEILGKIKLRGGIVTVEKVAINAVMAGARPEHFNAILAAMEIYVSAWEDNKMFYHALSTSDNNTIVFMLSGPIVNELGVMHGRSFGAAGNEPVAVIGHAIKLCIRNIGHSTNDNSAARYDRVNDHTMYGFGEHMDETRGFGWDSHSEAMGFGYDSNTITLVGTSFSQAFATAGGERSAVPSSVISTLRSAIGTASAGYRAALVTITPEAARVMAMPTDEISIGTTRGNGFTSKEDIQMAISAATPNANIAKLVWPVVAGKNPTNGRAFHSAMYGLSAFQTQLISGTIVAPSAPLDFEVEVGEEGFNAIATLTWSAPARADGLVKYQVSCDDGATWIDVDADATSYTFGELDNDTRYFFWVRAVNDITNAAEIAAVDTNVFDVSYQASGRGAWAGGIATSLIPATQLRIDGATIVTLRRNASLQLTVTTVPANATTGIVWSSSNPAAVTVGENGLVTGIKASGTAIISARTVTGTLLSTVTVRVTA